MEAAASSCPVTQVELVTEGNNGEMGQGLHSSTLTRAASYETLYAELGLHSVPGVT